jgi:hypothetical protein
MSGRVSRVLQASRDPSPIVTQPAGRHSASKLTIVYISSEEVDIGESHATIDITVLTIVRHLRMLIRRIDLKLDQDTHGCISG